MEETTTTIAGREIRIRKIERTPEYWTNREEMERAAHRRRDYVSEPCARCGKRCSTSWTKGISLFSLSGDEAVHPDDVEFVERNSDGWVGLVRIGTECRAEWKGWTVRRKAS